MLGFLLNNVYGHAIFVITIMILLTIVTRFNQEHVMYYGTIILLLWLFMEVFFILRAEHFWQYIGNLILAGIAAYALFFGLIFLCGKLGKLYMGDGGLIAIAPLTLFPLFVGFAIVIKALILFWDYLFN